jgi:hypothetical protein
MFLSPRYSVLPTGRLPRHRASRAYCGPPLLGAVTLRRSTNFTTLATNAISQIRSAQASLGEVESQGPTSTVTSCTVQSLFQQRPAARQPSLDMQARCVEDHTKSGCRARPPNRTNQFKTPVPSRVNGSYFTPQNTSSNSFPGQWFRFHKPGDQFSRF